MVSKVKIPFDEVSKFLLEHNPNGLPYLTTPNGRYTQITDGVYVRGTDKIFHDIYDKHRVDWYREVTLPHELEYATAEEVTAYVMDNQEARLGGPFLSVKDGEGQKVERIPGGAMREENPNLPRFDLVPSYPLERLAQHYANGAKKYSERNWEKGIKLMRFIASLERHLAALKTGDTSEDHEAAIAWNIFGFMYTKYMTDTGVLPKELDDYTEVVEPYRKAKEKLYGQT